MKRRTFLTTTPMVAVSMAALANPTNDQDPLKKAVKVDAGKDRNDKSFTFLGARFDLKVSGKDCNGSMSIYDTFRAEKVGPQLHSHTDLDEWFFVMEGEFKFKVGEEIMRLKAGDSLLGPRNIPHAFIKTSDGPARLMIIHSPAGTMEEYFQKVSLMKNPTPESRQALMREHNMIPIGPPLTAD